jgi:hypothetical protein
MNVSTAYDTTVRVSKATRAAEVGVVISVRTGNSDLFYEIWAIGVDGLITRNSLDCFCTDEARLTAHVYGFIANHNNAFAIKEAQDRAAACFKAAERLQALVKVERDALVAEEFNKGVANLLVQQLEWLMHAKRIAQ